MLNDVIQKSLSLSFRTESPESEILGAFSEIDSSYFIL
jgi:hypothetical protein